MVRQRTAAKPVPECPNSSEASGKGKKIRKKSTSGSILSKVPFLLKLLAFCGVGFAVFSLGYQGYLETRINTPLNVAKAVSKTGLEVPSLLWGTYRPGLYFGLKTRSPADIVTGLMWMLPEKIDRNNLGMRHWCEQGDNLDSFGWKQHDGRNFGIQKLIDRGVQLTTSFVKWPSSGGRAEGLEWSARIAAETKNKRKSGDKISLFFYVGLDEGGTGNLEPTFSSASGDVIGFSGSTSGVGKFKIDFSFTNSSQQRVKNVFFSSAESPGPFKFTETLMSRLRMYKEEKNPSKPIIGLDSNYLKSENPNFVVFQVVAEMPFQLDVAYTLQDGFESEWRSESDYSRRLAELSRAFEEKFEDTFGLKGKGFDDKSIEFAQSAMSNLIGGIGYFYGHSIVKSDIASKPVKYWDAPLYTAVPSRSFFPRGFLWDEGFHNLLISKWDLQISTDILAHWMDLINVEGWIPREQILGLEARAKVVAKAEVPAEFVIQNNKNANPPTLVLTLHSMISDIKGSGGMNSIPDWFREYLNRIWPRLEIWYKWFNTTQTGPIPGTFRWHGRNASAIHELNPKTLTSGLDDFPRASHPTDEERHVDLRCWMTMASTLLADIAKLIGKDLESAKYEETSKYLLDNKNLDSVHWSDEHGAYLDYGRHTEDVILERPRANPHQQPGQRPEKVRVVKSEPQLQFVNEFGYVSLFPFLLQIVDPASPKLKKILSDIEDEQKLFTPFGLRSLAKEASIYMKKNTEHDAPYWRGPIWINMNYLAVRALYYYGNQEGPYQQDALRLHTKLKNVIVQNVIKEYFRTGYIWEQYNDKTGHGQGCRPFTGWSTLVVLMMGDRY